MSAEERIPTEESAESAPDITKEALELIGETPPPEDAPVTSPSMQFALAMSKQDARTIEEQQETIEDLRSLRKLRKNAAHAAYWYLVAISAFAGTIIVLDGFSIYGFSVDSTVAIALLSSVVVSAIGSAAVVVRGLFGPLLPRKGDS